jgi:hypothetical protein
MGKSHYGVILLRLSGIGPLAKATLTAVVINKYKYQLKDAFTVVFKDHLKIRKAK